MSEVTNLAVLEVLPEQAATLYVENGLTKFLDQIRQSVNEVPDLSTAKGRARVASLAAQVSRSKTAVEKPGRDYLRKLKEAVKPAENELRRFVTECDTLRDEVRRPLTEWEADQERIAAEKAAEEERLRIEAEAAAAAEALKKQIESDHEITLLLNDKFDRDAAEETAQRERDEAARREAALKAQAEQAERNRIAAEELAER